MNLDSVKASLAKIPAWVKANPKKAAVVAVVVVVIAYFAIKRGASSSGEESTTAAPDAASLDSLGGGVGLADLSTGSGSSAGGGATTTTTTTESTGGGGFDSGSGGGFSESDFASSLTPSGFINSAPAFSGSAAAIIDSPVSSFRAASEMTGIKSPVTSAGIANKPAIIRPAATPVMAPKVNNTIRAAVKAPVVISKTDAEKAGLAKYYTGVSGGRRYVGGVFVGSVATATLRRSEKL